MTAQEKALEHYINNAKREIIFKLTHGDRKKINLSSITKKIKYKEANANMYDNFLDWLNKTKYEYGYESAKRTSPLGISIPNTLRQAVMKYKETKGITVSEYLCTLIKDDLEKVGWI